jgi:hypothetical protein
MVRIQSSVRTNLGDTRAQGRVSPQGSSRSAALAVALPKSDWRSQLARAASEPAAALTTGSAAQSTGTDCAGTGAAAPAAATVSGWQALLSASPTPAVAQTTSTPAAPTAESVFGAEPWVKEPTGMGPGGITYGYNPHYFATRDTATKVAQMVGGTVVQSNQFTPNGGPFAQSEPNYMVKLPDGRMVNPGLVASFYSHGYPQYYVDQMIRNEVNNA